MVSSLLRERAEISEEAVLRWWRGLGWDKDRLVTSSGQRLQVVYPGRLNPYGGPDLIDAMLATPDGELLQGDVEVHVRSSQWRAHGHHRDPAYDGLVLHVVWWDDEGTPTPLASGGTVPVLALSPGGGALRPPAVERDSNPAFPQGMGRSPGAGAPPPQPEAAFCLAAGQGDGMRRALEELGEARFRHKGDLFREGLSQRDPPQVLYEGLMEALGYLQNRGPFLNLARALPYAALEERARGLSREKGVGLLYALLMGQAGFSGPAPFPPALDPRGWHTFRVRPANLPQRRLRAASHLLSRYLRPGLLPGLLGLVERARGHREIETGLVVGEGSPALLGRGRAGEMAVNALLPFAWAWGQAMGVGHLAQQALDIYRGYPRLEENELTRLMRARLLVQPFANLVKGQPSAKGAGPTPPRDTGLACQEQGMIHLYRNYCRGRRCASCPVRR